MTGQGLHMSGIEDQFDGIRYNEENESLIANPEPCKAILTLWIAAWPNVELPGKRLHWSFISESLLMIGYLFTMGGLSQYLSLFHLGRPKISVLGA